MNLPPGSPEAIAAPAYFFLPSSLRSSSASRSIIHSVPSRSISAPIRSQKYLNRARCSRVINDVKRTSSVGRTPSIRFAMGGDANSTATIDAIVTAYDGIDKTGSFNTIGCIDSITNRESSMLRLSDRFRIVITAFGYPMWASPAGDGYSDRVDEATVFGRDDNPEIKLKWFRAFFAGMGLDSEKVNVDFVQG